MNARINGSFSHLIEQEKLVQLELRNQLGSLAQIKVLVTPYRILDSFDVRTTEMLDYHEVE
jgi:hypothetical protein